MQTPNPVELQLLRQGLRGLFGEISDNVLNTLLLLVEWVDVPGGGVLVKEGDDDDDLYCIISGRLRVYVRQGAQQRFLGEMRRGETVGEVAFFTGTARSATVIAVRDSVLVRLTRPQLENLLASYPHVMMIMARLVARRLSTIIGPANTSGHPVNICLLPITPLARMQTPDALADRLIADFSRQGTGVVLDSNRLAHVLDVPGIACPGAENSVDYRRLTQALDELESRHELIIYVPDPDLTSAWSRRCLRMADRVLLLADGTSEPCLSAVESNFLGENKKLTEAEQWLVLLYPQDHAHPINTRRWLDARTVKAHLHIRPTQNGDMARLLRTLTGRSIGLVFGDGGARCFAQLGVYAALCEAGIPIDYVGGSSFGALMAAAVAMSAEDLRADELVAHARAAFRTSPTADISLFPVLSLIKGRHLNDSIEWLIDALADKDIGIEDTWKTFFCIAGNYSTATETVLTRGPLSQGLRASCAIPGMLPPVPMQGDLMVDGATFNSFPADIMREMGASRVIGVAISRDLSTRCAPDKMPGNWALWNDKLTGRRKQYRLPSLMQIMMNSATLFSASRAAAAHVDLNFTLNLRGIGLLDWHKFDDAVNTGRKRAVEHLATMSTVELNQLQI